MRLEGRFRVKIAKAARTVRLYADRSAIRRAPPALHNLQSQALREVMSAQCGVTTMQSDVRRKHDCGRVVAGTSLVTGEMPKLTLGLCCEGWDVGAQQWLSSPATLHHDAAKSDSPRNLTGQEQDETTGRQGRTLRRCGTEVRAKKPPAWHRQPFDFCKSGQLPLAGGVK